MFTMRMKSKNSLFILLILVIFVLLFTACSEKEPQVAPTEIPGNTPVVDVTDEPTAGPETPTADVVTPTPEEVTPTVAPATPTPESATPTPTPTVKPATPTPTVKPATPTPTVKPATPTPTPDVNPFEGELPRVDIATEGRVDIVSKEEYINATISVSRCGEKYVFTGSAAKIRVRGNSTAVAPKKPYRIKFEEKQSFLGLNDGNEFKNWCLMADYYDGSMLRTWATFNFAKVLLEDKYYSADCTPVEVYVNGKYNGVYLLCEHTQINEERIDIPKKEDADTELETGYLLIGQGGRTDEPGTVVVYPGITVTDRNGQQMKYGSMNFALSGSEYTSAQKKYVSDYVSGVFKVVASAVYENKYYNLSRNGKLTEKTDFTGKTAEEKQIETISAVFNIESAVAMCVLDEIVKNLDAMTFNMYVDLSPEGDGVLTLAAPWDFDFAMANTHYSSTHSTSGFYATNLSYSEGTRVNLWYVMLGHIDWFEEMCRDLWLEHYAGLKDVASQVYSMGEKYADAYERDYDRWGLPADRSLIHHHCTADLNSYKKHMDVCTFLNSWLNSRLRWLNSKWGDPTVDPLPPLPDKLEIDFTKSTSTRYLNGYKRCEGRITAEGLKVTLTEAHDPYFYVDFSLFGESYDAANFGYIEIVYKVPSGNSSHSFSGELFLCSGTVSNATAGISTVFETRSNGDSYVTLRIDLLATGYWNGEIHKIRFDIFNSCEISDTMTIKSVTLLPG